MLKMMIEFKKPIIRSLIDYCKHTKEKHGLRLINPRLSWTFTKKLIYFHFIIVSWKLINLDIVIQSTLV